MRKTVFLVAVAVCLLFSISKAEAGCNIVLSGDLSGSLPTNETSRTQTAVGELCAYLEHPYCGPICGWYDGCYEYEDDCYQYFCINGTWSQGFYCTSSPVCLSPHAPANFYRSGTWDVVCDPTLIQLSSFTASPKSGEVVLTWSTESEIDNAGFNIYRAESENGEYNKVNDALIPTQGSPSQGAAYQFTDENLKNRKTYYYKLEDVDVNGVSTFHGPVNATPRFINVFR